MPISITTPGGGSSAAASGAPTDADYVVETAQSGLSAEVVLGTTAVTTAAYASRQAAAKAGRLFLPSNSFYVERDTGSAWAPWGPIWPMTPPVDGDFTWMNQGSASVTTTNGGIVLATPGNATSNIRARVKSIPSVPYTITACFLSMPPAGANYTWGLLFRQSSDGKIVLLGMASVASSATITCFTTKWTNETTFSAAYTNENFASRSAAPIWMRIADDNTNRICSVSADGVNFAVIHSVTRTDFLTADQIGFHVRNDVTTTTWGPTLISWKQA